MPLSRTDVDPVGAGRAIHARMAEMFPICRSIRETGFARRSGWSANVPLEIVETPTGTQVLDWTVPNEWNIRAAWVDGPDGARVVDFADSNLHVLNYSAPVDAVVSLEELREHVFTHPDDPTSCPTAPRITSSGGVSA